MNDTLLGSLIGGLVVLGGSVLTYLGTRGKDMETATLTQAQMDQAQRNSDITLIIETLQEQVKDLREEVKGVRQENAECLADRDLMRGEIRRLKTRLAELEQTHGGC